MIVTNNTKIANRARYLSTTAKDDGVHYIHHEVGFNYRLNNMQSALGLAQLKIFQKILKSKRNNYQYYRKQVNKIGGLHIAEQPTIKN